MSVETLPLKKADDCCRGVCDPESGHLRGSFDACDHAVDCADRSYVCSGDLDEIQHDGHADFVEALGAGTAEDLDHASTAAMLKEGYILALDADVLEAAQRDAQRDAQLLTREGVRKLAGCYVEDVEDMLADTLADTRAEVVHMNMAGDMTSHKEVECCMVQDRRNSALAEVVEDAMDTEEDKDPEPQVLGEAGVVGEVSHKPAANMAAADMMAAHREAHRQEVMKNKVGMRLVDDMDGFLLDMDLVVGHSPLVAHNQHPPILETG